MARAVSDKEGVLPEIRFEHFIKMRGCSEGQHIEKFGIKDSLGMRPGIVAKGIDQILRLGTPCGDEYLVPPVDMTEYFLPGGKFPGTPLLQFSHHCRIIIEAHRTSPHIRMQP